MKKQIPLLLTLLFAQQLIAATFYGQLCTFNFNWKKYALRAPAGEARTFQSDREYIQAHLGSVIPILRSNPVLQLSAAQYQSRTHLIEVLDRYRMAGNFPLNYYRHERIPVFIDPNQTHCAVGYLLQESGHEDLALRIAAADNYAWVKDIHDPELLAWQESSGFTLEELKLIQGAYDYYMPNALVLPNKYEVPQQPACMTAYFDTKVKGVKAIWCRGEGANGILNGRWEQNFSAGLPWIVGYYENGQRSGQWKEYYQGTRQLCRTENWRNNKLNGIRKRYNRAGILIEEILFKDGNAVTKTNYDLDDSLVWVRKPVDSNVVWTQVYTFEGALIALGHEKIYNPGNLLWFQNIELTALNSISISARTAYTGRPVYRSRLQRINLYSTPPLVQYNKIGIWKYYKEYSLAYAGKDPSSVKDMFEQNYPHFGSILFQPVQLFEDLEINSCYDSIRVSYKNDVPQNFYGYGNTFTHLRVAYYYDPNSKAGSTALYDMDGLIFPEPAPKVKEVGQYNELDQKTGTWKYYDESGQLYKTESFIVPRKEENEMDSSDSH